MDDIKLLLLCGLFFMPIAVILAMGVFWAYIWVKDGLYRVDKEEREVINAIMELDSSARVTARGGLTKNAKRNKNKK